ncbi:hypothetical protein J6590_087295 [Homalodisca vitripennis]|nr:hypothetical protein J6590_087295 [Homalodisca vitripennis]
MLSHVVTPEEGSRLSLNHLYPLQNVLFKPIFRLKVVLVRHHLSISTPVVAHRFVFEVLPDFYGGDHAPVKLSDTRAPTSPSRRTRWILTKADWERFKSIVSTCDSDIPTDVNKALRKLRSVYGRPPTSHILGLKHLGLVTTDQLEMANILSSSFAEVSITSSYTEIFETVKTAEEARPVDLNINNISPLNLPFSMVEIQTALASSSFELMYRTR